MTGTETSHGCCGIGECRLGVPSVKPAAALGGHLDDLHRDARAIVRCAAPSAAATPRSRSQTIEREHRAWCPHPAHIRQRLINAGCSVKQVQLAVGQPVRPVTLDMYGHLWPRGGARPRRDRAVVRPTADLSRTSPAGADRLTWSAPVLPPPL